jgi:hypothetical protein
MTQASLPRIAAEVARWMARVVLPEPPFWLTIATVAMSFLAARFRSGEAKPETAGYASA